MNNSENEKLPTCRVKNEALSLTLKLHFLVPTYLSHCFCLAKFLKYSYKTLFPRKEVLFVCLFVRLFVLLPFLPLSLINTQSTLGKSPESNHNSNWSLESCVSQWIVCILDSLKLPWILLLGYFYLARRKLLKTLLPFLKCLILEPVGK